MDSITMADTINVPLLGPTPKGGVLAGGLAVVGVGGYLLYKHFTKPTTMPATGTPASAYGYGASAYGYGTVPYAYGYGMNAPYGSYGFGGSGGYGYGGGNNPYGYGGPPQTNAQWGADAESNLGSSGSDAIALAIGKYLSGGQITQAQYQIIQEAEATLGPPPQPGPNGYPPKAHVVKGGGGGGGNAVNPVTGLHVTKAGSTGVDIAWSPSQNATSYQVTSTHGNPGMTGATSARVHSVGRHTTATVSVLAEPAAQGATPATIQIKTN
jgi:hypothetical protein